MALRWPCVITHQLSVMEVIAVTRRCGSTEADDIAVFGMEFLSIYCSRYTPSPSALHGCSVRRCRRINKTLISIFRSELRCFPDLK